MVKKNLSKSEIKELNEKIACFGMEFDKKDTVVYVKEDDVEGYVINGQLCLILKDARIFPSLRFIMSSQSVRIPSVMIDIPAVKFIANGADVMRPGIKQIEDFPEGSVVVVRDEIHKKPIAVAYSDKNSQDLKIMEIGKVLKNLSYVGDRFWNYEA